MNRFGHAGKLIQNGYRWCDHRDTLPRREYRKSEWIGKFPEGSVDADLISFELDYLGKSNFDFSLESCPKGVLVSMDITAKICDVDGESWSHEKWRVDNLSEDQLWQSLYPPGIFWTILPKSGFWVTSVSIRNVKRTPMDGQSADSSGISMESNSQDANSSGTASASVAVKASKDQQTGKKPKKVRIEPDSSETEESSDSRPDGFSSSSEFSSSEDIPSSNEEIDEYDYTSRSGGKSTAGTKAENFAGDKSASKVSAKSPPPMAKSPPTDSGPIKRQTGQSTSAATGDSQVGVKFGGDGKLQKGKSPVAAKKKKLTKRRQK